MPVESDSSKGWVSQGDLDNGFPEPSPLPGPKKKQMEALRINVQWLVDTFGEDRIGFLTMTCGDWAWDIRTRKKIFVLVKDREEASRRLNSMMKLLRRRYRCGVTVMERHDKGGIHYHLVCVAPGFIRRGFRWADFDRLEEEVKKRRRLGWLASEVGANRALQAEWEFFRGRAGAYGFGRCQMLPMRKNGAALGAYAAKYVSKSWDERLQNVPRPDNNPAFWEWDFRLIKGDKGARLVRYFGKWATRKLERKIVNYRLSIGDEEKPMLTPPHGGNFARMAPKSRMWRSFCRQIQKRCEFGGVNFDENNVKFFAGRRWAYHWMKKIRATRFFTPSRCSDIAETFAEHDFEVLVGEKESRWGVHISDEGRGVEFWGKEVGRKHWGLQGVDEEWIKCRIDNARAIELQEAFDEVCAWADATPWFPKSAGVDYVGIINRMTGGPVRKAKPKRPDLPKNQRLLLLMNRDWKNFSKN